MRRAVDTLREPGHDNDARLRARRGELAADTRPVRGHAARADDAHRARREDGRIAIEPERLRRSAKIEEPSWVPRIRRPDPDHGSEGKSNASATSSLRTPSDPARSAAVRATRNTRW